MVELLSDWRMPSFPIHLLWLPGADRTPALRALIDHLAVALATPGGQGRVSPGRPGCWRTTSHGSNDQSSLASHTRAARA